MSYTNAVLTTSSSVFWWGPSPLVDAHVVTSRRHRLTTCFSTSRTGQKSLPAKKIVASTCPISSPDSDLGATTPPHGPAHPSVCGPCGFGASQWACTRALHFQERMKISVGPRPTPFWTRGAGRRAPRECAGAREPLPGRCRLCGARGGGWRQSIRPQGGVAGPARARRLVKFYQIFTTWLIDQARPANGVVCDGVPTTLGVPTDTFRGRAGRRIWPPVQ